MGGIERRVLIAGQRVKSIARRILGEESEPESGMQVATDFGTGGAARWRIIASLQP
jgi:hypothetical protein